MKQLTIASLLMLSAPVWASTPAPIALWQTDFKNGRLPSGVTASAVGQPALEDRYKHGWSENGWSVSALGRVYCALSPSSTMSETPVENILALPAIALPEDGEGLLLRWSARSLLPQLPESYEIRVRPSGTEEWETVCRIAEEEDQMTTRAIPLDSYAGREIEISFVCVSVDRYMLALGEIYVGIPASPVLTAVNTSLRLAENALPRNVEYEVTGRLSNAGAMLPAGTELKVKAGENPVGTLLLEEGLSPCASLDFRIPSDFPDNETTAYEVTALLPDGTSMEVMKSDVTRSGFARTLLVDEGTGIWCNNCPRGTLDLSRLERQYPGQVAAVCTHVNDILANDGYWSNLGFYAVPYMMLNRQRATAGSDTSRFASHITEPTMASISVVDVPPYDGFESNVTATVEVMFDRPLDVSGRYGIGYVLTSPFHDPAGGKRWMQNNVLSTAASEQYYILPSLIPADLSFYEHVSIGADHAFDALPIELPDSGAALAAYEPYRMTLEFGELFSRPNDGGEEAPFPEDISLVAYVVDIETGTVLNATSFLLQQEYFTPSGVKVPVILEEIRMRVSEGRVLFTLPESGSRYEMTVCDVAGRRLTSETGTASGATSVALPEGRGFMIVTLSTPAGTHSIKIMK